MESTSLSLRLLSPTGVVISHLPLYTSDYNLALRAMTCLRDCLSPFSEYHAFAVSRDSDGLEVVRCYRLLR